MNEKAKCFPEESKCLVKGKIIQGSSKLVLLKVKLDENKVMRCDTRLANAQFLPYNTRYPIATKLLETLL